MQQSRVVRNASTAATPRSGHHLLRYTINLGRRIDIIVTIMIVTILLRLLPVGRPIGG